jgi:hypothetical protein
MVSMRNRSPVLHRAKDSIITARGDVIREMARRFKKPKPIRSGTPFVTLPKPSPALGEFTAYLAAQFNRTTLFLRNEMFANVVAAVDAAYAAARTDNRQVTPGLARMYLTCHQAMFSGAACIAHGVPLDAAAASRRALEAARTALAIKLDRTNGERWIAYEDRMSRWRTRDMGEKPPNLKIKYDVLIDDEMGKQLACIFGILSDAAVHFTPEFLSRLDFKERDSGTMLFSEYLETDEQEIAHHLKMFAAVHLLILKALDRCCDGGFSAAPSFCASMEFIVTAARALYEKYPRTLDPELEKQLLK